MKDDKPASSREVRPATVIQNLADKVRPSPARTGSAPSSATSGSSSSATSIMRVEQQLLDRIKSREERRDAALKTPGGDKIAASYQREIDLDKARLDGFRRAAKEIQD